mgnify:CR=1 FL=1|tara:strand:+ start:1722 stop:1868 length:147 start_codon:yes stop_codon:yes gene_type:complete
MVDWKLAYQILYGDPTSFEDCKCVSCRAIAKSGTPTPANDKDEDNANE